MKIRREATRTTADRPVGVLADLNRSLQVLAGHLGQYAELLRRCASKPDARTTLPRRGLSL